jgi:hypothetical protein
MGRRDRERSTGRGNSDVVKDERGRGGDVGRQAYQDPNQRERNANAGEPGEGREQRPSVGERNPSQVGGKRAETPPESRPQADGDPRPAAREARDTRDTRDTRHEPDNKRRRM